MGYVIGMDFGTQSGRAVVVNVSDGSILAEASKPYTHGVIDSGNPCGMALPPDWVLADPEDYLEVMAFILRKAILDAGIDPAEIIGLGLDATSCSILPVDASGTPLCMLSEWKGNPNAYIKLWKHHAAMDEADRITALAKSRDEAFLRRCGSRVSCEWAFPKMMETLRMSPEVYASAAHFIDLGDWLVFMLTGSLSRSVGAAAYKSFWSPETGYPSSEFWGALDSKMEKIIDDKFSGPVLPLGSRAGRLSQEMAEKLGLPSGISVSVAGMDGHAPLPALGVLEAGDMLMVVGTSTTVCVLSDQYAEIPGICGVAKSGMVPGKFCYESGQSCVGDLFEWYMKNMLSHSLQAQAISEKLDIHRLLAKKAGETKPGESGLIALDWWNGNRSILADMDLTGAILGMTLRTKPEDIYRALVEATAFGIRRIVEEHEANGIAVQRIFACGGIAAKDSFVMQLYADVLGREIRVSPFSNAAALGNALFAAVAAGREEGGYAGIEEASSHMADTAFIVYRPTGENVPLYDRLYGKYVLLHDLLGLSHPELLRKEACESV